jgi:hypothetical protein
LYEHFTPSPLDGGAHLLDESRGSVGAKLAVHHAFITRIVILVTDDFDVGITGFARASRVSGLPDHATAGDKFISAR